MVVDISWDFVFEVDSMVVLVLASFVVVALELASSLEAEILAAVADTVEVPSHQ